MSEEENNLIAKASRNAMILRWLRYFAERTDNSGIAIRSRIQMNYAKWADMPIDEVVLDYITDEKSLDYFWKHHENVIRIFEGYKEDIS